MPYIECQNRRLYYESTGRGCPILFIHPPGMGCKTFMKQKELEKNYHLILLDLSGQGNSTRPERLNLDTFVEDVEVTRKELGIDSFFLFGYSAGGIVAQEYTIRFPDRVKGLLLSGAYPKVLTKTLAAEHHIGIWMAENYPKLLAKIISISHYSERSLQQELYHHMIRSSPEAWKQFYLLSLHYDCIGSLSAIRAPMLLLYGTFSDFINAHVRYYQKIMDTDIQFIPFAGHQIPTRKPKQVNKAIDQFIKSQIAFNDNNIM